jgi:hypothetical protein
MHGLYIGSATNADIRLQVTYGIPPGSCSTGSIADRIICQLLAENLHGNGSITIRATGEVQTFQITGAQALAVGMDVSIHRRA